MTALKIAAIAGSMIIAAGGSAAIATRDKWWPGERATSNQDPSGSASAPEKLQAKGPAGDTSGKQCDSNTGQETTGCKPT